MGIRNLSLTSKLTITVALLFFFWWLFNEYQTYRYTVRIETKEFIADHYIAQHLGVDIANDFVADTKQELKNIDNILTFFPKSTHVDNISSSNFQHYFLSPSNAFVVTPKFKPSAILSHKLIDLLKPEYEALIVQDRKNTQLISRNKLSGSLLNIITAHIRNDSAALLSWFTFSTQSKTAYAIVFLKKADTQRIGFLINLSSLLHKLNNQDSDPLHLLITAKNEFIGQVPNDIDSQGLNDIRESFATSGKQHQTFESDSYLIVKAPILNSDLALLTLTSKRLIYRHSLMLLVKKLPSSILLLILISILLLFVFQLLLRKPINTIVEIISDPNTPNLSKKLPQHRNDELGKISSAYNQLIQQLQESHSELEQQVASRTKYLLEASQAAQAANERKTEHLTSISHEIRTPLNGILGALELIQTTSITQKQKGLIITATDCCQSLLSLVNNLLDFSRIEAGEIVLQSATYQPIAVIDEAMVSIESQATNKGISLTSIVESGIPEKMQLDPLRVRQILVNLLGNAVKFTEQGEIKVILRSVNQMLEYQIHDTGSGMTDKETLTVFLPYVQGQHQKFGSGLGLPISKKLAKMMDGNLTLTSTINRGSCFTLTIPIIDAGDTIDLSGNEVSAPQHLHSQLQTWGASPVNTGSGTSLDAPELQYMPSKLLQCTLEAIHNIPHFPQSIMPVLLPWKLKVLVVDDVGINRDIISKMLNELGQTVYTAPSAYSALELGKRNIFDLVLMDIRMPEVNGYEATQIWRNSNEVLDNSCPIIALTANAEPQEQAIFEKAGMDYYITKPVTLRQLNHALEIAVDIQLERDVSLTINNDNDTPLLDLMSTDLTKKLHSQLLEMLLGLKGALEVYNWEVAQHILHTIKGTCGLAGLQNIADSAAELELKLQQNHTLKISDLNELNEQLKAIEFNSI